VRKKTAMHESDNQNWCWVKEEKGVIREGRTVELRIHTIWISEPFARRRLSRATNQQERTSGPPANGRKDVGLGEISRKTENSVEQEHRLLLGGNIRV